MLSAEQFSDALTRYPKIFSPLYINMVKASELSGGFRKMLDRVAGYLSQQIEIDGFGVVFGIVAVRPV